MAGTDAHEGDDAPMLRRADRTLGYLENGFTVFSAASIFILMFLATAQVLLRKLLNFPIPGYIDFAEQSIAVFAFLAVAYCQRVGGHVRMELVVDKLKGRALWLAESAHTLPTMLLVAVLGYFSFWHFERAWRIGDSTIDISLPTWPSKLMVPLAFAILVLRLGIQVWGYARLIRNPDATPIAVPLIADVAEQAQREGEAATADPREARHG